MYITCYLCTCTIAECALPNVSTMTAVHVSKCEQTLSAALCALRDDVDGQCLVMIT